MSLQDLADNRWVVYIVAAILILSFAAEKWPGILGGFGRALQERRERKRRVSVESDDADITEMQRQIKNLTRSLEQSEQRQREADERHTAQLAEIREYQLAHDAALGEHAQWDRHMIQQAADLDPSTPIPARPPLWPAIAQPRP